LLRSFGRALPACFPGAIGADRDPDSLDAELRHDRAVAAAENASPGAKTYAVQLAPLSERQDLTIESGRIERAPLRPDSRFERGEPVDDFIE
jgi:hypothetical protein